VPTPLERLERAYADADAASGADFFRRLRDYKRLLDEDDEIRAAVERINAEMEAAQERLDTEDAEVVAELVRYRGELVERAPEVDDSSQPRPPGSLIDRGARRALDDWMWTLSNFDAIAADADDKLVQRSNLDGTDARMLGEILNAKLYNLQHPEPTSRVVGQRPDLDGLYEAVNAARGRHAAVQQHLEEVSQSSGFLPLRRVAWVVSYLEPREAVSAATEDEEREQVEAILMEVTGDFHHLREAVRPEEARGRLDPDAQRALERHEPDSKNDLANLHRALRQRVEEVERDTAPKGWKALTTSQKIAVASVAVGAVGVVVTVAAIVVAA
jgi:hypothetical protein